MCPVGTSDTLRSVIDSGRSSKRLDELSSARVIGKIAQQLHAAQQKAGAGKAVGPVIPANIKLAPSGEAKLELAGGSALGYSAPEQIAGGTGDRRSDVFSLGAVLWEALTYTRLFDAMNDAAVRAAVQEREIAPPSEINANVPAELSAICMRALARNPADRYQSLKAMAVEIEEFLEEAGYEDDDSKIAAHLAALREPPKQVTIQMAPLTRRPSSSTQPPPRADAQLAQPSILGEPPKSEPRPRSPSGAALAAALANAGTQPGAAKPASTVSASADTLPQAKPTATLIGVPKLGESQDSAAPTSVPLTPVPPVLPSGSTAMRTTLESAVPPPVNAATVDAKHAEPAASAAIVAQTAKPVVAGEPPAAATASAPVADAKATLVDAKSPAAATTSAPVTDTRPTLVDTRPPEIEVPKLVNGRLPDSALPTTTDAKSAGIDTKAADAKPTGAAATDAKPADAKPADATDQAVDTTPPDAKPAGVKLSAAETLPVPAVTPATVEAATARAPSASEGSARAPSQSDAVPSAQARAKSAPHPAAAVSLGPIPRARADSKGDVLAGWGWGTDKHNAIAPDGYADDDYEVPEPNTKKTLVYVIGGGLAVAGLVTIIALAFGGSKDKKNPAGSEAAAAVQPAQAPSPTADSPSTDLATGSAPGEPSAEAGSAADPAAAGSADAQGAAETAALEAEQAAAATLEEERAAAAKLEEDKAAAAKLEEERAAAAKLEAEQAAKLEAERVAAAKLEAKKAEQAKAEAAKAEAARLAADAAAAKTAERERVAAERKAKAEAARAEAARVAAARAEARKADAARKPAKTTKTAKTAQATKTESKVDAQAAYRQGLQQFARGDTNGALRSLRTSLAANPRHAPTWRGLGLVFEKMGEKDQARAAFKRYLQLAPSASDAGQIRQRLERLGS